MTDISTQKVLRILLAHFDCHVDIDTSNKKQSSTSSLATYYLHSIDMKVVVGREYILVSDMFNISAIQTTPSDFKRYIKDYKIKVST